MVYFCLKSKKDIQNIKKKGQLLSSDYVNVYRGIHEKPGVGTLVYKKDFPKAVTRNRAKRLVRAMYQNTLKSQPYQYVFLFKKKWAQLPKHQQYSTLKALCVKK